MATCRWPRLRGAGGAELEGLAGQPPHLMFDRWPRLCDLFHLRACAIRVAVCKLEIIIPVPLAKHRMDRPLKSEGSSRTHAGGGSIRACVIAALWLLFYVLVTAGLGGRNTQVDKREKVATQHSVTAFGRLSQFCRYTAAKPGVYGRRACELLSNR
jgi:hypothetical protein